MAIRGKTPLDTRQDLPRFALSLQRQCPDLVRTSRGATLVQQSFPVPRPIGGSELLIVREQNLFRPAAVRELATECWLAVTQGEVGNPLAVGGPNGKGIGDGAEGQAGANTTRQIQHPDVINPCINLKCNAVPLRGQSCILQVYEPGG